MKENNPPLREKFGKIYKQSRSERTMTAQFRRRERDKSRRGHGSSERERSRGGAEISEVRLSC